MTAKINTLLNRAQRLVNENKFLDAEDKIAAAFKIDDSEFYITELFLKLLRKNGKIKESISSIDRHVQKYPMRCDLKTSVGSKFSRS